MFGLCCCSDGRNEEQVDTTTALVIQEAAVLDPAVDEPVDQGGEVADAETKEEAAEEEQQKEEEPQKEEPKPEEKPQESFFDVSLARTEGSWGVKVENYLDCLQVTIVREEGAAKRYNESAEEQVKLLPGDIITQVNDVSGREAILAALKDTSLTALSLRVCRLVEVRLTLARAEQNSPWGLTLENLLDGMCVTRIRDNTSAAIHNDKNPSQQILKHDVVVAANGAEGKAANIMHQFQKADVQSIDLTIKRLPAK